MGNIFNKDFQDFIQSLNDAKVEYILLGGYATIIQGYNRPKDQDDVEHLT